MRQKNTTGSNLRYWFTVLSACSIGETLGDLVSHQWGFGYVWASLFFLTIFAVMTVVERRARVRSDIRYWLTIMIMSTTGTTLSDLFTRTLRLGYTGTSTLLMVLFSGVLLIKRARPDRQTSPGPMSPDAALPHVHLHLEHTDMPDTDTRYWVAIMVASTLGTSLGDFVSNVLNLGFGRGSILLGSLLAVDLVVDHFSERSNEARYWIALVLASTIGATSGDYLTKEGGLNLGFLGVIVTQVTIFAALIMVRKRHTAQPLTRPV